MGNRGIKIREKEIEFYRKENKNLAKDGNLSQRDIDGVGRGTTAIRRENRGKPKKGRDDVNEEGEMGMRTFTTDQGDIS